MTKPRIRIIEFNDWEAFYIDGKLVYENHSVSLGDFLAILKANGVGTCMDAKIVSASDEDDLALFEAGRAPKSIDDYKSTKGLK
jgi:hypothetical protein